MRIIDQAHFKGERCLFGEKNVLIKDSVFSDGESPLKESRDIELDCCLFRWKYPLWYAENVKMTGCSLFDTARAGIWYTKNVSMRDMIVQSPKTFRRSDGIFLYNVAFTNAAETLWNCTHVKMSGVTAKGDYFAMNCTTSRQTD